MNIVGGLYYRCDSNNIKLYKTLSAFIIVLTSIGFDNLILVIVSNPFENTFDVLNVTLLVQ